MVVAKPIACWSRYPSPAGPCGSPVWVLKKGYLRGEMVRSRGEGRCAFRGDTRFVYVPLRPSVVCLEWQISRLRF
jgi:hypothetical protein